ncbi:ankyrin repeat-containing domain protein [Lactarius psammicola]|nr:ankyrin repeat-containing domain protein [Lactarius psammicola]
MSPDGVVKPSTPILQPNRTPNSIVQPPLKRGENLKPSWKPPDERPPLYTASENGQLDIVLPLLDRGSDVNETESRRRTALHAASGKGRLEVAKLLIERGAYTDSRSMSGWTPSTMGLM